MRVLALRAPLFASETFRTQAQVAALVFAPRLPRVGAGYVGLPPKHRERIEDVRSPH